MKFTISIPRESCTNVKAKYSSSVVPPDPSVHFYHRRRGNSVFSVGPQPRGQGPSDADAGEYSMPYLPFLFSICTCVSLIIILHKCCHLVGCSCIVQPTLLPVVPPGFCNRGRGSEIWVYRGSRVRSPPVPVVLSVYQRGSLLDGLAMRLSCDTKKVP